MGLVIPQPDGPDVNIGARMMATVWTLIAITIVVVGARTYTQAMITRQIGLGDGLMIFSEACLISMGSMLTKQFEYGLGRHFYYLNAEQRIQAIKYNFVGQSFGVMGPTLGRMSFIVLMIQLFGTTKYRKWGLWALFWQTFVVNLVILVEIFAQCEHPETLWDPVGTPSKWCLDPSVQTNMGFVQGALNAATDLFLTCLPITMFWSLQMTLKLKIGLAALLGMSIFAFVAVIIKTIQLQSLGDRGDFTYNTVPFFTWVIVEFSLVNIAASVPLIRPLFSTGRTNASRINPSTSYELNQYGNTANSRSHTGYRFDDSRHGAATHDGSSEENILAMDGFDDKISATEKAIIKKTTYDVTYDNKKTQRGSGASWPVNLR